MRRSLIITAVGAPPEVGPHPGPAGPEGTATFRLAAAGLNPADLAIGAGRFYLPLPTPPFVAGCEAVGRVERAAGHAEGTRAWCLQPTGCLSELVSAPEDRLVPVPDGVDDVTAAAVGVPAVAGWMAVGWRGALAAGERVLVLGASGVAGQVAVSAARLGGAGAVVAAGRSARGLGHARAAGAAAVVDLTAPDLPGALRAACPDGVDLVVDMLWGEPLLAALPLLRPGGRIVQVGNAAAPTLLLPAGPLRGGRLDLRGYSVFSAPFADVAAAYVEVARAAARGEVVLHVEVVPLEGARAAWARLAAGTGGMRIVLVP